MSDLPYDVVVEILSRFPAKSLLRFKSVCKQWFSLISDPKFAVLQYKRTAKNSPLKILMSNYIISSYFTFTLKSLDCSTKSLDDPRALRQLNFPFTKAKIIGSCNGLICLAVPLYGGHYISIWNPCTGAYRKLPDRNGPLDFKFQYDDNESYYGFGYDSSTNDYKVFVYIPDTNGYSSSSIDNQAYVFTSKNNSWKRVQHKFRQDSEDYIFRHRSIGSLLNGSLHWLTQWSTQWPTILEDNGSVITAFDLAEEKFSEVPMPDPVDYVREVFIALELGVFGGHLCLVRWISDLGDIQGEGDGYCGVGLWMMKEYGVKSSWEKLYHFGNSKEFPGKIVPCAGCGEDEDEAIILTQGCGEYLVRYHPNKETKLERFRDLGGSSEAVAYSESLVSPHVCVPL